MGAEEKNRNEVLSRVIADLSMKSKQGNDLSSDIHRLRDAIRKVIENEDTVFGKFRGLVESFRGIIPEEKQRYNAAIMALSATSKLGRQEIITGFNNQLEELKILEKGLIAAFPGWHNELKAMEAKTREMRDEISKLREKIGRLEREEKEILNGMAAREKEMELVEKTVGQLFVDIGAEIASVKKKVEDFTVESAASQPAAPGVSIKSDIPGKEAAAVEQENETLEYTAPQETGLQKKCPMCGGQMNFHMREQVWMCYSCAYEELPEDKDTDTSKLAPASDPTNVHQEPNKESLAINNLPSSKKKTCPVCRKKMNWYQTEKAWRCSFCQYERKI